MGNLTRDGGVNGTPLNVSKLLGKQPGRRKPPSCSRNAMTCTGRLTGNWPAQGLGAAMTGVCSGGSGNISAGRPQRLSGLIVVIRTDKAPADACEAVQAILWPRTASQATYGNAACSASESLGVKRCIALQLNATDYN